MPLESVHISCITIIPLRYFGPFWGLNYRILGRFQKMLMFLFAHITNTRSTSPYPNHHSLQRIHFSLMVRKWGCNPTSQSSHECRPYLNASMSITMVGTHCGNPWSELVVSTYSRNPLSKPVVGTNEWNPRSEVMFGNHGRNQLSKAMVGNHDQDPWHGVLPMTSGHIFRPWFPPISSDHVFRPRVPIMCSGRGFRSWVSVAGSDHVFRKVLSL